MKYHFVMRLKLPTPPDNSAKKFKIIGAVLLILGFFLSLGGTQDDGQFRLGVWVLCIGGLFWLVGRFKE